MFLLNVGVYLRVYRALNRDYPRHHTFLSSVLTEIFRGFLSFRLFPCQLSNVCSTPSAINLKIVLVSVNTKRSDQK